MRRSIASLLLALFSLSLLGPIFAADPDANLPECCRRNGRHHCSLSAPGAPIGEGVSLAANSKCAQYPQMVFSAGTVFVLQKGLTSLAAPHRQSVSPAVSSADLLRTARTRSHQKRGPPAFSSAA